MFYTRIIWLCCSKINFSGSWQRFAMHTSAHNVVLCNSHEVLVLMTSYLLHILQWWARGGLSDSPGIKIKKQRACITMIPHSLTRIHRNQASLTVDSPSETCHRKSGHMHSLVPLNIVTEEACDPGCHGNLEYHSIAWSSFTCEWMFIGPRYMHRVKIQQFLQELVQTLEC